MATPTLWRYFGENFPGSPDGMLPVFDDYLLKGGDTATGPLTAPRFISTQPVGVAPFDVTSTTMVANLNVEMLGGVRIADVVRSDGTLLSAAGTINFAANTAQKINLSTTAYALGVQNSMLYTRAPAHAWFSGGVHSNVALDPGTGGTLLMDLSAAGMLTVKGLTSTGDLLATGRAFRGQYVELKGASAGLELQDRDLSTNDAWVLYNSNNIFRVYSALQGQDVLQASAGQLIMRNHTEFVLGNAVGANPSWRFHWNGSDHYMDIIGGANRLIVRPGAGTANLVMDSRNYFKDSERNDGTGLRVGAAWGRYGIYAENGDLAVGSSGGRTYFNNGLFIQSDAVYAPNAAWSLWAQNNGGGYNGVILGRHSDNQTYIDGGSRLNFRTDNGATHSISLINNIIQFDQYHMRWGADGDSGFSLVADGRWDIYSNGATACYFNNSQFGFNANWQTGSGPNVVTNGYGLLYWYTSSEKFKSDINDLEPGEALNVLGQLRPRLYTAKRRPQDSDFVAELLPFVLHVGLVAEEVDAIDSRFELVNREPSFPEGATAEEAEVIAQDLDSYKPVNWDQNKVVALLVAGVQELEARIKVLEKG